MDIKILEEVCWGGSKLAPIVDAALQQLNLNYRFEIRANPKEILKFGIAKTPSLVVNGKVVFEGKVPSILEMPDILLEAFKQAKQ